MTSQNDNPAANFKKAKEEILATAWKEAPPAEVVQGTEPMDMFIQHYLTKAFNPNAYTWLKATQEDAIFVITTSANSSKAGAEISQAQVKTILDKHAAPAR